MTQVTHSEKKLLGTKPRYMLISHYLPVETGNSQYRQYIDIKMTYDDYNKNIKLLGNISVLSKK